jgi:hypothetical protein
MALWQGDRPFEFSRPIRRHSPNPLSYKQHNPDGFFLLGARSYKTKLLGTTGCSCTNNVCTAGGQFPTLTVIETDTEETTRAAVKDLMTKTQASFMPTNGPLRDRKFEYSLNSLQFALRNGSCSQALLRDF